MAGTGPMGSPLATADAERRKREQAAAAAMTTPPATGTETTTAPTGKDPTATDLAIAAANGAQIPAKILSNEYGYAVSRHTQPPTVTSSTAAPVTVGPVTKVATPTVTGIGTTTATPIDRTGIPTVGLPTAAPVVGVTAAGVNPTGVGVDLQNRAAAALENTISGKVPSVAQLQGRAEADRIAAEQASIAAGARGLSTAAARRVQSTATSLGQQTAAARVMELRAQETAAATGQLSQLSGQARGQDIEIASKTAELKQRASEVTADALNKREEVMAGLRLKAQEGDRDAAVQLAIEDSRQKLQAGLASDERISKGRMLEAELKLRAAQGDQTAATDLQKVQAQLTADLEQFNAKQLQGASAENATNYLKAAGLDDEYVAKVRDAWIRAEQNGDAATLDALRLAVSKEIAQMQKDKDAWDKIGIIGGFVGSVGKGGGSATGGASNTETATKVATSGGA